MKIVIQCCATKNSAAGSFKVNGQRVKFIAHPELYRKPSSDALYRPDDLIPSTSMTWRERLVDYNQRGDNPDSFLPASDLYSPKVYRSLLDYVGSRNLFILSAGWGLVRSDFLIPDYDITFSSSPKVEPWKRRTRHDHFADFSQLSESELAKDENIYFFGGKDYLPLFCSLTRTLMARKVVYFASSSVAKERGFDYRKYKSFTNWHYRCAENFMRRRNG